MESPSWTEYGMKELEGKQRWPGDITKKVQEIRLRWYGHQSCIEKRRRMCGQESDGGAEEKKERKTEAEVVG